jgi:hypothetical protein
LCQSELLDTTIEKIKELETDNLTTKVRLEAPENWALKLNEKYEKVREEVEGSLEQRIGARIDAMREEVLSLKENIPSPPIANAQTSKSCKECEETFSKNFELENHMIDVHGCHKSHSCDICGKSFILNGDLENTCKFMKKMLKSVNKLGLSCAKLSSCWAS